MRAIGITEGSRVLVGFCVAVSFLFAGWAFSESAQAGEGTIYELVNDGKIGFAATSTGSQKSIRLNLMNPNSEKYTVVFPYGTIFWAGSTKYQNLALVETNRIHIDPNTAGSVVIQTACMNAGRAVAPLGYPDWTVRFDSGLAQLLDFFYSGQAMFGHAVKPEWLSTEEKKREFLQGVVWVYADATKEQMRKFARKYMFSSTAEADLWVDTMYGPAKMLIDMYKMMHGSRTLGD